MEAPGDTVTMVTDCPEILQKPRIEELPVHRDKWVAALSKRLSCKIWPAPPHSVARLSQVTALGFLVTANR
jgi:hypothetical protein